MTNEILEISKWLHEKGFECDWWEMDGVLYPEQEAEYEICNPYISLNRALELLPESIEKKDYITQEAAPQWGERREDVIFCLDKNDLNYHYYDNMGSLGTLFEDQDIKDYHLAALRLLKKTVEEGYVKAN